MTQRILTQIMLAQTECWDNYTILTQIMWREQLHRTSTRLFLAACVDPEESFWSGWNRPAWCSGGQRHLIAGCVSLQRIGMNLPVARPVWDSNPRPPASESRSWLHHIILRHNFVWHHSTSYHIRIKPLNVWQNLTRSQQCLTQSRPHDYGNGMAQYAIRCNGVATVYDVMWRDVMRCGGCDVMWCGGMWLCEIGCDAVRCGAVRCDATPCTVIM